MEHFISTCLTFSFLSTFLSKRVTAYVKNLEISSPAVFRVSRHTGIPNKQKTMQKSFPYAVTGVKCPYPARKKKKDKV